MQKLTIVGYGPFTRLLIKHLQADFDIQVCSRNHDKPKHGLKFSFVTEFVGLANDTIIVSIPAQFLKEYLTNNLSLLNPEALIVDVCSVKTQPIKDMLSVLPASNQILGTHPIFGPGSAKDGLKGLAIALCPARIDERLLTKITHYLQNKELDVQVISSKEHDARMAEVLGLTQYIGHALKELGISKTTLSTPAYDALISMRDIQGGDSWDLFESIMGTPEAKRTKLKLRNAFDSLDDKLDS